MKKIGLLTATSQEEIRHHVAQILDSQTFQNSGRLRDLLAYLAERSLGSAETPKEHEIATKVFGRAVSFNPQDDSIVRVQAGRLRQKLGQYYAEEAPGRTRQVQLLRGSYALVFEVVETTPESGVAEKRDSVQVPVEVGNVSPGPQGEVIAPGSRPAWLLPGLGIGLVALFGIWLWRATPSNAPTTTEMLRITKLGTYAGPSKFSADGQQVFAGLQESLDQPMQIHSIDLSDPASPSFRVPKLLGYPGQKLYSVAAAGMVLLQGRDAFGVSIARTPGAPAEPVANNINGARWNRDGSALMVVRLDGNDSVLEYPRGTELARSPHKRGEPFQHASIAKSGRWIAFGRPATNPNHYELWVLDCKDRTLHLVAGGWKELGPSAWRADEDEIVVGGIRQGEGPAIYAIRPDGKMRVLWRGTHLTTVEDIRKDGSLLVGEIIARKQTYAKLPHMKGGAEVLPLGPEFALTSISADGKTLLLTEPDPADRSNHLIYIWRPETEAKPRQVTTGAQPALSPDGTKMLVVRYREEQAGVVLFDLATKVEKEMSQPGTQYSWPIWVPDGEAFQFVQWDSRTLAVHSYIQNIRSGRVSTLTGQGEHDPTLVGTNAVAFQRAGELVVRDRKTLVERIVGKKMLGNGQAILGNMTSPEALLVIRDPRSAYDGLPIDVVAVDPKTGTTRRVFTLERKRNEEFAAPIFRASADGKSFAFTTSVQTRSLFLLRGLR